MALTSPAWRSPECYGKNRDDQTSPKDRKFSDTSGEVELEHGGRLVDLVRLCPSSEERAHSVWS